MKQLFFHLFPYFFIFVIWGFFVSPYVLKKTVPYPATYQVNTFAPWSAYEEFAGPVKNGAMPDVITQMYPWRYFTIQTWKRGEVPLWNPYSFSGTPHLANYQSAVLSPFNVLFFIFPFLDAWSLLILLQPLLSGMFMYPFMRSIHTKKAGSLIAAISFMFCGFLTVWMGYGTLDYAILFLPLALFAIEQFFKKGKPYFLLLLMVTIPLSFFSGHFQISIYFFLFVLCFTLYMYVTTREKKKTIAAILFITLGLFLTAPQLFPSIEYYLQSYRSSVFQKNEAIPLAYLPTFLAPDFFGNPVTRNDWFGHYAEWNGYFGAISFLLAGYILFRKKSQETLFFLYVGIGALLLAFNTPILDMFIQLHIPVLSTSALSRIIVIFSFCFSILAGKGSDQMREDIQERRFKYIVFESIFFTVILCVLWSIVLFKLFLPADKLSIARSNLLLPSYLFCSFLFLMAFSFFAKGKKKSLFVSSLVVFLVSFDLLRFAMKWQSFDPRNLVYPQTPTTAQFQNISSYQRVFGNLGGEALVYFGLPSIEGYDALYIKRYGEFIASLSSGTPGDLGRSVVLFPKNSAYSQFALNLLGVRYIIHKLSDDHAIWTFPFWRYPNGTFVLSYKDNRYEIYTNTLSFPRAFLADSYRVVEQNHVIQTLFQTANDARHTLILASDPMVSVQKGFGSASITSYKPTEVIIKTTSAANKLLFLSDNYYPGWNAYIDGVQTPIFRADYTFRSVFVPKGEHIIQFVFAPMSFSIGILVASFSFLISVLFVLVQSKKHILS